MKLKLTHYGRKGVYAYICPLTIEGGQVLRGGFINGDPIESDRQRFHKGQSATVEIDLAAHPDGLYEYKEANGHKSKFGYLKVKGGEIIEEWFSKETMLEALMPAPELPELEGSARQVSWAESIRLKAIRAGFPVEKAIKQTSAKAWIDNRDKLPGQKAAAK